MKDFVPSFLMIGALIITTPAGAIDGGSNDTDTLQTNATVWASRCTGTLITPDIVLSAGHCSDQFGRPPVDGPTVRYPAPCADEEVAGRWYPLPSRPEVRIGNDLSDLDTERVFSVRAVEYAIPGCADIIALRLEQPVPPDLATPVKVLTRIGEGVGARAGDAVLAGARFTAAGWGRSGNSQPSIRQTIQVRLNSTNDSFLELSGLSGVRATNQGDSGGPIYWDAPSGRRYLVGALQGFGRDNYTPTFRNSHSGFPHVGAFIESIAPDAVSCDLHADRPEGTRALVRYYSPNRRDNFTTAHPAWTGCTETRRSPDYKMSRLEGYLFDPARPQPPGTVRLYSWWNGDRKDNVATSWPTWIYWEGGSRTRDPGYALNRLEGFVYDPSLPQPQGTRPLYAWFSPSRGDHWVTTQHATEGRAGNTLSPDYANPTLMGYVMVPPVSR